MARGVVISPVGTDPNDVQDFGPGGVLNQLPSLKATAELERKKALVMNGFGLENQYSASHPDAQSDGDEYGRGENNNQVGTKTDQLAAKRLIYSSGNKYMPGKGYDSFDYPQEYW